MAKTIDLASLERRAERALARWPVWGRLLEEVAIEGPHATAAWLKEAAAVLPAAHIHTPQFAAAKAAVAEWHDAVELQNLAARLWHDPQVNAVIGSEEQKLRLWAGDPADALRAFVAHSVSNPAAYKSGPLREALDAIGTAVSWADDHPSSEPASVPSDPQPRRGEQTPGLIPRGPAPGMGYARSAPHAASPEKTPAEINAEWAAAVARYERRHPEEADETEWPDEGRVTYSSGRVNIVPPGGNQAIEDEWTDAIAAHERIHGIPEDEDPMAPLPPSYYGDTKDE